MTEPANSSFVYVTYIRTTPEKLWAALTTPEFTQKYWFGMNMETEWKAGSSWKLVFPTAASPIPVKLSRSRNRSAWFSDGATNSGPNCTKRATRDA